MRVDSNKMIERLGVSKTFKYGYIRLKCALVITKIVKRENGMEKENNRGVFFASKKYPNLQNNMREKVLYLGNMEPEI